MPSCYFYALDEDRLGILRFIFENTDCKIYETTSEANHDLRSFETLDNLLVGYDKDKLLNGFVLFNLYSPSMKGNPKFERTEVEEKPWQRAAWYIRLTGWGLIQLHLNGWKDGRIDRSDAGCNSEKRALKWESPNLERLGSVTDWNWEAVSSMSGKLCRHIRKLGVDKIQGKPIIPVVHKLITEGKRELHVY